MNKEELLLDVLKAKVEQLKKSIYFLVMFILLALLISFIYVEGNKDLIVVEDQIKSLYNMSSIASVLDILGGTEVFTEASSKVFHIDNQIKVLEAKRDELIKNRSNINWTFVNIPANNVIPFFSIISCCLLINTFTNLKSLLRFMTKYIEGESTIQTRELIALSLEYPITRLFSTVKRTYASSFGILFVGLGVQGLICFFVYKYSIYPFLFQGFLDKFSLLSLQLLVILFSAVVCIFLIRQCLRFKYVPEKQELSRKHMEF